jgi:NAD(P)-dependent dehydrogenase (short-subunit alcohol dehydrogenase family)
MPNIVLITGCSTGIGKSTALYFANKGWNVIATMRQPETSTDFKALPNVLVTRLDVQEPASIRAAIDAGIGRFGSIDVLVNNAGYSLFGVFETISDEKVREQFEVNVFGVMNMTRAILPHFRQNKHGLILNISSGAGVFTLPMISLYCSSKFALEGFSEGLSYELASQNITVKIIEPGGVSTDFGKRSQEEAAHNTSITDYDAFMARANALFASMRAERLGTGEQIAETIYTAATDGSDQFRYIATDDIKPLIKVRREGSEDEYIQFMRSRFS